MAEQVSPTRSNLIARRAQRRLAVQGVDLLKRKRDALIAEFFNLVKESLAAREKLAQAAKDAYFALFLAKAWDSPEAVESLALARQAGMSLELSVESIYGVKVPKINVPELSKELPFSPIGAGARTLEAAGQFQRVVEALIAVAATENKLKRIGDEIKKTSRRVNALEQIVVPNISAEIKLISDTLDQRALEEVTVLKRIKAKIDQREAEEAVTTGGALSAQLEVGAGL
jgi:V/A-type H+/Na+-transporting ATPase subunit D